MPQVEEELPRLFHIITRLRKNMSNRLMHLRDKLLVRGVNKADDFEFVLASFI